MRHGVKTKKLGRRREHRLAMLANMAASLIEHRKITTTLPKAKLVMPFVDKLATLAKRGDLSARRLAASRLRDPGALKTLFDDHAKHWSERSSGFSRWARLGPRKGDAAEMAVVELLVPVVVAEGKGDKDSKEGKKAKPKESKAKASKSGAAKTKKAAA
jgi:large subunit ribosomal protein L17